MKTTHDPLWLKGLAAALVLLLVAAVARMDYQNYQLGSTPWELAESALLLSIPASLFGLGAWLLAAASWQRKTLGAITPRLSAFLYWMPRIAGIVIALFVSLFALDVFDGSGSIWMQIGAFIMHALPALLMGGVIALAWRKPLVGFGVFLLAALFFLRFVVRGPILDGLSHVLLFSGPMGLIAALFWVNWRWNIQRHPAAT